MSILALHNSEVKAGPPSEPTSRRAQELANRLEQSARDLADVATALTEAQWQIRVPKDGRTIGVLVYHMACIYPLEVQLAQAVAAGRSVRAAMDDIDNLNATRASRYGAVTKEAALELLRQNSAAAATAIRAMTDEQLDRVALVALYGNTPLTCQFVLEDQAVRHAYHHLARIKIALKAHDEALERLKTCVESNGTGINCIQRLFRGATRAIGA